MEKLLQADSMESVLARVHDVDLYMLLHSDICDSLESIVKMEYQQQTQYR